MIRFPRALAGVATAMTLLSAPVQALDLASMSEAERAAFGAEVRAYLLENPEVIIEAVNLLEQRQAEAEAVEDEALVAANLDELYNDGFSWVGGNPDGDITVVEFMDYRCGYCRRAAPEVEKLIREDGNIRLVIKEFPILGEASLISSRFAIATRMVAGADSYKLVHDALIDFGGEPSEVSLRRLALGLGLDADVIMAKMNDPELNHELAQTRALAQRLKISGTPTFVVQDELLRGYLPADQMSVIVADKRDQRG
ncbi:DsbA family protein [Parasedimentitalea huanghaiensis]|uniref:Thioredoxin domain-containing protein n=1 Tax=Parasedimentitalea huanghaiensis TaxID=2682100 RepID=A0A6L6WKD8_9RHOB|nr:DsbA family protein [Zongyanglinia huanghaiensis]MVO18303.1 thioredoxin domain-containing protein [Zongyanglinia huanghaiensis]